MPQPTNSDILREIKEIKSMQDSHAKDISILMSWKIGEDAAKAAVAHYRDGEKNDDKRKLMRDAAAFMSVLLVLIWAIIQYVATRK